MIEIINLIEKWKHRKDLKKNEDVSVLTHPHRK